MSTLTFGRAGNTLERKGTVLLIKNQLTGTLIMVNSDYFFFLIEANATANLRDTSSVKIETMQSPSLESLWVDDWLRFLENTIGNNQSIAVRPALFRHTVSE